MPIISNFIDDQVDFVLKHYKDISPFLRRCTALQLSPDFFIPQDMADDDTAHSTIVDSDEPWGSSISGSSSGSENMMMMSTTTFPCTEFVRKKRSGLYVCGRTVVNSNYKNISSDEDMATSMSRRKGIPQRSPLC